MRVRATMLRVATGVLPVLLSTLVLVVVAGALPAAGAWALVASLLVLTTGLLAGLGEGAVCRLLTGARTPTDRSGQCWRRPLRLPAGPAWGRRWSSCGCTTEMPGCSQPRSGIGGCWSRKDCCRVCSGARSAPAAAAASICHAAAVTRAGLTSTGPAFAAWCLPWSLLRGCAAVAGRLTVLRLAWRARLVVVSVTVVQLLLARHAGLGVGVAALAGVSYLLPATERARAGYVTAVGDDGVQATGLGRDYVKLLEKAGAQVSLERRARLLFRAQEPARDAKVLDLVRLH